MLGLESATAIGARDDLQQVPVGIVEIEAAAVVPAVDRVRLAVEGVRPVGDAARLDAGEDLVELGLADQRSEEHTSELQSLMRISYAVLCLKKKNDTEQSHTDNRDKTTILQKEMNLSNDMDTTQKL